MSILTAGFVCTNFCVIENIVANTTNQILRVFHATTSSVT